MKSSTFEPGLSDTRNHEILVSKIFIAKDYIYLISTAILLFVFFLSFIIAIEILRSEVI